jgi:long-chain acyl-CoA synthetase
VSAATTANSLPDLTVYDTLPKLLALHAREHGNEIALREKQFGIWRVATWADVQARVRALALGLRELKIGAGDVIGLIGDNRPDWVLGEIAAHAIRGLSLGIYRDALDEEVAFLLTYADVKIVFAEDEEQVDKLLSLGSRIESVRHIVYSDPRGMRKYADSRLLPIDELVRSGERLGTAEPVLYDALVRETKGSDVAILCTTSGTTANPKLAMLPAAHLIRHCASYLGVDPKGPHDEYVSVLPLPWIMEQVYAVGTWMVSRMRVNFVEEPETTMHDFREIGPSFVLFAPRVWEAIAADVRARMMDASPLKRRMFDLGMRLGIEALRRGRRSRVADLILFRALRDRLGFTNLKSAATGGAALGPDTFRFFQALGVPLRQIYGQTETMGAYTVHRRGDIDYETVGVPFNEAIEVKVTDPDQNGVGGLVARHPNMFTGYYKNEAATFTDLRDGWMQTGDAGFFDKKGHLVVIDRTRDLATTAGGVRFSPQYIENKLKFSPYIAEAVILGDSRDFLSAIICIRFPIVSKWAEKKRIAFTTYADLSAKREVTELLRAEVERVNTSLPDFQRIAKFLLLYKELDADDGELTRTRKVRRGVIADKYAAIIDAIYAGKEQIEIDTTIAFQDGTKQRIRTAVAVVSLLPAVPRQSAPVAA